MRDGSAVNPDAIAMKPDKLASMRLESVPVPVSRALIQDELTLNRV
jgi:hypothetical protein